MSPPHDARQVSMLGGWSSRMQKTDTGEATELGIDPVGNGDTERGTGPRMKDPAGVSERLWMDDLGDTDPAPGSSPPDERIGGARIHLRELGPKIDRAHDIPGTTAVDPGDGFTISEVARFLRADYRNTKRLAKKLGLLKRLPHDRRYRALTREQVKVLIVRFRTRTAKS